jgi:hypothetical protein
MKIHFITIVLDCRDFIGCHLPIFNTLNLDWHWHIAEGTAKPVRDTSWCREISPRLSIDGTTEYLDSIKQHRRVTLYRRTQWDGKTEMVNAPLSGLNGDGLVFQIDSDELWTKAQIERVHECMGNPSLTRARFRCRYFFGPDIAITSVGTYGNRGDEWTRVWRWKSGQLFEKHEPPIMSGDSGNTLDLRDDDSMVFQHYAYATEEQVAFKERYYGYAGAVEQWKRLQANRQWPARLGDYCKWVKDETTVDKI